MGADSDIGVGTPLAEERLVGVHKPDASETTELVLATDPRRRDDCSRQFGCVPTSHHDKSHSLTGRDMDTSKTDRGVLLIASTFKIMLRSNETIDLEEPRVIGGHSLRPIVKVSALNTFEDIEVLCTHRRVVLSGRITRPTQDIGETMWSARCSRDWLDLMIQHTQMIVGVGDVEIEHRHHPKVVTIEKRASTSSSCST